MRQPFLKWLLSNNRLPGESQPVPQHICTLLCPLGICLAKTYFARQSLAHCLWQERPRSGNVAIQVPRIKKTRQQLSIPSWTKWDSSYGIVDQKDSHQIITENRSSGCRASTSFDGSVGIYLDMIMVNNQKELINNSLSIKKEVRNARRYAR